MTLIEQLDQALPQTQCQRCGYPACRPYAEALAAGEALANRCPPGGQLGVKALSKLLGEAEIELDLSRGSPGVGYIVKIDPAFCIGCTKCIRACPVDAIIGANKRMHTVIPELCTGCELCIPPCPTDCITLEARPQTTWTPQDASDAQKRYYRRLERLTQEGFDVVFDDPEVSDQIDSLASPATFTPSFTPSAPSAPTPTLTASPGIEKTLEKALQQARARLAARQQQALPGKPL